MIAGPSTTYAVCTRVRATEGLVFRWRFRVRTVSSLAVTMEPRGLVVEWLGKSTSVALGVSRESSPRMRIEAVNA